MAEANDVEDFVTCGVCFYEFDDVERKPKFLPCSHTVCLSCLKAICKGHLITCPFCREMILSVDVASLPNNPYALHMLKFKDKKAPNSVVTLSEIHWCLTCGSAEKPGCSSSGHNIGQSSSGVYVLFPMTHLQFQPVVSNMMDIGDWKSQHYNPVAEQVDEVGITNLINDGKNAVTGWSFIFPMKHFRDPNYKVQVNNLCSNKLFGRIIQRPRLELAQACVNYIITLESQ